MSEKIKIVDVERFIMSMADGLFYQMVEFFKVRIQYRKNLIFMWKKIDKRWRIFATCYVRPYSPEFALQVKEAVEDIKWFNDFSRHAIIDRIERKSSWAYGFSKKLRTPKSLDLNFEIKKISLGDMDQKGIGKV